MYDHGIRRATWKRPYSTTIRPFWACKYHICVVVKNNTFSIMDFFLRVDGIKTVWERKIMCSFKDQMHYKKNKGWGTFVPWVGAVIQLVVLGYWKPLWHNPGRPGPKHNWNYIISTDLCLTIPNSKALGWDPPTRILLLNQILLPNFYFGIHQDSASKVRSRIF